MKTSDKLSDYLNALADIAEQAGRIDHAEDLRCCRDRAAGLEAELAEQRLALQKACEEEAHALFSDYDIAHNREWASKRQADWLAKARAELAEGCDNHEAN